VFDGGWHSYATAMWLLGDDVEKVSAMITRTSDFMLDVPSTITWKLRRRDCLVVFGFGHAERMPIRGRYYPLDDFFEIQGSEGVIWVTRCTGEMLDLPPVVLYRDGESTAFQVPSDWAESFKGAARNFIDCLLAGEQPDMDVEFSTRVLRATLAAYRASDTNAAVDPSSIT
jgi:predicted dehydrogenase